MNVEFTLTNGIYIGEVDEAVFGVAHTVELEELSYDSMAQEYEFEIRDWWALDYSRSDVPASEAEDSLGNIDPKKVLLWLLKKLKESLCPECS